MVQLSTERNCLQFLLLEKERVELVSNISTFQSPTSGLAFLPTYSTDGTSMGWRPEGSWEQCKWWVACGSWHGFAWLGEDPQLETSQSWGRGVKSASRVLAFLRAAWGAGFCLTSFLTWSKRQEEKWSLHPALWIFAGLPEELISLWSDVRYWQGASWLPLRTQESEVACCYRTRELAAPRTGTEGTRDYDLVNK